MLSLPSLIPSVLPFARSISLHLSITLPIPLPLLLLLSILILTTLFLHLSSSPLPPTPLHPPTRTHPLPLNQIPPIHPLSPYTPLPILYTRFLRLENSSLRTAHAKHGPIIRLAPREISVNCVAGGIRDIYAGGFEKGFWYAFFENYGIPNMFSTPGNKPHSIRKRMLSNIYSKSVITSSRPLAAQVSHIVYRRFLPYLFDTFSQPESGVLNIYSLISATTMDIVTGYIFGLASSSDFIRNPDQLKHFLYSYTCRHAYNFFPQELPRFTGALKRWLGVRLVPTFVDEANREIQEWTKGMCEGAAQILGAEGEELSDADRPVVYAQLRSMLEKERAKSGSDYDVAPVIASELLDHLAAGFDTSGITLTYVVHELSKHPSVQSALRSELLNLSPPIVPSSAPSLPDAKTVDLLPLLHAVVWETLRLHSAIPGPQPRVTPASGCRLGPEGCDYWIPGGVRVSASAGILHANEEVFENADQWQPSRWLGDVDGEQRKEMDRWFWAFGSGGRMCVGSHLAVHQMKVIVAAIYSSFKTVIVDDADIEQVDAYTAPPKNDRLVIRLERVA